MRPGSRRPGAGFTLIELLMVIAIIGVLMTFIMVASFDAVESARQRSTASLIVKLDGGVADRLEALNSTRPQPNGAHNYLAAVFLAGAPPLPSSQRAQAIAQFDMVRAELLDGFVVQADANYPLNFGALPYPGDPIPGGSFVSVPIPVPAPYCNYVLPLGTAIANNGTSTFGAFNIFASPPPSTYQAAGTGIFGASYTAAAGIYKNLGYKNAALNGVDDGGVIGLVDDWGENGFSAAESNLVRTRLANHRHETARSEALYAVMIEGRGPFGSLFRREDFSNTQVADTDGDGLPEFIDGWGKPLQFYRWPVHFTSDLQKGLSPYRDAIEVREKDPLDPNNQLVAPAWWSSAANTGGPFSVYASGPLSGSAFFFQAQFHSLIDPNAGPPTALAGPYLWNRANSTGTLDISARREYYSKFLIASSGRDQELGIAQLDHDYANGRPIVPAPGRPDNLVHVENTAGQVDPIRLPGVYQTPDPSSTIPPGTTYQLMEAGADDITNHNASSNP